MKRLLISLFIAASATADEGMWMPQQMPEVAPELRHFSDLTAHPLGAVVSLGNCTASFVSPEGLVVTNHHCAFGSIQHNSTPERDLIANGFLARTRDQELPAAPGSKVWVTTAIEDVTARMIAGITAKTADLERARLLDRREKELVRECENGGASGRATGAAKQGVRCRVSSFFEGSQYLRTRQAEIADVRLVYAPSRMVGEFGGEIDNFEWPRHTGDFAFYRAYVDGKPFRPKHWLKVATEGVDEGDTVIVAGYPGRTFRYKTADEVRHYAEFVYPTNIRYFTDVIGLLEEAGKDSRDIQIRNASRIKSMANSLKNNTSVQEGFTKDRIVESRLSREAKMSEIAPEVLGAIAKVNAEHFRTRERDNILDWLTGRGSPMLQQAFTVVRLATERPKKDVDRVAKYMERDWPSLRNASDRAQRMIEPASDRSVVAYLLAEAKAHGVKELESVDLDALYAKTKIGSQEERTKMLGESVAQLKSRKDAMLDLSFALLPLYEVREREDLAWSGAMARLRPGYFEALRQVTGGTLYPDANSTLRVTIGKIEGYAPRDATFLRPQTTLQGLLEKETGKDPFENPKALLAAAREEAKTQPYVDAELRDVPVNFLSTCDTTGGNSGSPTLNTKGELVGLLFDGNYESIDADFLFNPAMTRSIHVDTEYMLWVMEAVDGATELMKELGVARRLVDLR